ncbi:MAG: asparagine synthetase B, partial [Candidatus Marinimicrobia bacterium]|nr:asparagine synthetase B [Candidatus Neomarinimicrobiota bacterium]
MCGFVGIVDFSKEINMRKGQDALESLKHRGPDAQGSWSDGHHIYLGHNRLSIIDVSKKANQPFLSSKEDALIVFNGEIYNYKELRNQLSFDSFITNSDTETILEGYLEQGVEFFKKLRGIYAFVILDRRGPGQILMVRDPAGVKPLYYTVQN